MFPFYSPWKYKKPCFLLTKYVKNSCEQVKFYVKILADDIFRGYKKGTMGRNGLKNKIYKFMISISKNVYIDDLDDIVNEYRNIYPRTIKMMVSDIKSSTYIHFNKENIKKDPKCEVGHHVRILKCKIIFVKGNI